MDDLFTADDAARQLGLTAGEILHMAYHGELGYVRQNGQLMFPRSEVDGYEVQLPFAAEQVPA